MKIKNVSIAEKGPLIGHGLEFDDKSLQTLVESAPAAGVPVRMDHVDSLESVVGTATNFRVEGNHVRGDLTLLTGARLFQQAKELLTKIPNLFGFSIVGAGAIEKVGETSFLRLSRLWAADLVQFPAANSGGVFGVKLSTPGGMIRLTSANAALSGDAARTVATAIRGQSRPCFSFLHGLEKVLLLEEFDRRGGLSEKSLRRFNMRRSEFCRANKMTPEEAFGQPESPLPQLVVESPAEAKQRLDRLARVNSVYSEKIDDINRAIIANASDKAKVAELARNKQEIECHWTEQKAKHAAPTH